MQQDVRTFESERLFVEKQGPLYEPGFGSALFQNNKRQGHFPAPFLYELMRIFHIPGDCCLAVGQFFAWTSSPRRASRRREFRRDEHSALSKDRAWLHSGVCTETKKVWEISESECYEGSASKQLHTRGDDL
jgi:hypothetical protein